MSPAKEWLENSYVRDLIPPPAPARVTSNNVQGV